MHRRDAPVRLFPVLAGALLCGLLAACTTRHAAAPPGDLQDARLSCNRQYPQQIGSYLPHAQCVNAAVETYAVPTARYPDLVRLQEEARSKLSQAVDQHQISERKGARRMAQIDRLVAQATHDRDAGDTAAAERRLKRIEKILR
jgi:hypothetical protein